jgi:hypothetical protein
MGPPLRGKSVRLEETESKPPQGKLGALLTSKPRLSGQVSWKCAAVRGRRAKRGSVLASMLMVQLTLEKRR